MIKFFSCFGDILIYPLYHISEDALMGILFYMLVIFFVLNMLCYVIHR